VPSHHRGEPTVRGIATDVRQRKASQR
jgi:hypothetical protein